MKKTVNILNIILIVLVLIGDAFYIIKGTLPIKTVTSIGFVLIGVVNLIYLMKNGVSNKKFPIIMVVGLFFAMLGDVLLEVNFIVGALLFAVGHIFYFIAYCFICSFNWKDLIYGGLIFIPATIAILFAPIFEFPSDTLKWLCVVYAIVISCMTGKSISNFVKQKTLQNILLMIGSMLFLFSDLMLLFDNFSSLSGVFGLLCLLTYYPAECLLSYSILLTKKSSL